MSTYNIMPVFDSSNLEEVLQPSTSEHVSIQPESLLGGDSFSPFAVVFETKSNNPQEWSTLANSISAVELLESTAHVLTTIVCPLSPI